MLVELTKMREVPGVATYWRAVRGGKVYDVQTYPNSNAFGLCNDRGRAVSGQHLVFDIRSALCQVGAVLGA
jgi:hypothetical protein